MPELNWIAVLVAAVAYYVLGAVWFTPLFGRVWDRSIGYDRSATRGRFPLSYYITPLFGALVSTFVAALLVATTDVDGVAGGVLVGLGVGLVAAAASVTNALTPHTPKPYLFGAVTGGYHLTGLTIAGAILGAWQ